MLFLAWHSYCISHRDRKQTNDLAIEEDNVIIQKKLKPVYGHLTLRFNLV